MPISEEFDAAKSLAEYRGIRGGEKGEKAPVKTPPRVRMPVKAPKSDKFEINSTP